MKRLLMLLTMVSTFAYASDFTDLVKNTASVFSTVTDVDASNPHEMGFETLLTGQKVFLNLSSTHLNSSFYTLVNSDSLMKRKHISITPPVIKINNLQLLVDGSSTPTSSCDGGGVSGGDVACTGKECNIVQRVISKCNETNCWQLNPTTDRLLTSQLSENFSLLSKVEISDCLPSNLAGEKHVFRMTVQNQATNILNGGTISYALMLFNDVSVAKK